MDTFQALMIASRHGVLNGQNPEKRDFQYLLWSVSESGDKVVPWLLLRITFVVLYGSTVILILIRKLVEPYQYRH